VHRTNVTAVPQDMEAINAKHPFAFLPVCTVEYVNSPMSVIVTTQDILEDIVKSCMFLQQRELLAQLVLQQEQQELQAQLGQQEQQEQQATKTIPWMRLLVVEKSLLAYQKDLRL